MDRNTATGLVLIFILMAGWFYFTMPSAEQLAQQQQERATRDSLAAIQQPQQLLEENEPQEIVSDLIQNDTQQTTNGLFGASAVTDTSFVTVQNGLYTATFTNLGAGPSHFILNEYATWDGEPIELIQNDARSVYNVGFLSTENYNVDTRNLLFSQVTPASNINVTGTDSQELSYALELSDGRQVVYTYTFYPNSYEIDLDIRFVGVRNYIVGSSIDFSWDSPLNFTEKDRTQDGLLASAYTYTGGELEQLKLTEEDTKEETFNGDITWVSTRTKFFSQIIKPVTGSDAAILRGSQSGPQDDPLTSHAYQAVIQSDVPSDGLVSFELYVGPLKYDAIKGFDEHAFDMVEVGYAWIRWFSDPFVRFAVIPFFSFMSGFISNYGLLVIIFAIVIKLCLSPLTYKSFKSMAAMRELQPQMKEIQEKYKDNPQKQQQETMKMYKKAKVNPLGGCLPNLLQFPILITLWRFFQNSIILRQKEFLWASDLSAPDYILSLPFSIPFLGPNIAGFVLLMTAAMIVQSRLTGGMSGGGAAANPQMKVFQYIFPVMLLFIFNNFAAGLSLYYLVFNVLSIVQQVLINKSMQKEKALATS